MWLYVADLAHLICFAILQAKNALCDQKNAPHTHLLRLSTLQFFSNSSKNAVVAIAYNYQSSGLRLQ